jgi:hypothetical protein
MAETHSMRKGNMKTMMLTPMTKPVALIAILILSVAASSLHAQTWQSFGGTYSGDWEDGNHWSTAAAPTAGQNPVFNFHDATSAVITLNANTPNLGQLIAQGGSLADPIPERDLTIDLNGNALSLNVIAAPSGAYREVGRLTFKSTGGTGTIDDVDGANGAQFYMFNAAGAAGRPTTSYVTFSTNTQATLWHTYVVKPTADNTLVGYLTIEANAQVTVGTTALFQVAPSGGTAANPVTGTVTLKDTAKLAHTSANTLILGSADGYSTGNLTVSGGSTDVDLGTIDWHNGTFTVELDSPTAFNSVNITGNLTIDAGVVLNIDLLPGVAPAGGQTFDLMTCSGTLTGEFTLAAEDADMWTISYPTTPKRVVATRNSPAGTVVSIR